MSDTHKNHSFFPPFNSSHLWVLFGFSLFYLTWNSLVIGIREDHFFFWGFVTVMLSLHTWTRKFAYYFVFFIIFWIIYDSMRAFPNYLVNDVHIIQPYEIEKLLFGISHDNGVWTLNEYLIFHQHEVLDIITGLFYLTWVPVPLGLAIYLFFTDKKMLLRFTAAYLFTNLLGFCVYYSYPAAPPWYFERHGDVLLFNTLADAAQLVRFDRLIGYPLFSNMYTKNSNVFAAIPSLHSAYPVVAFFYARKKKLFWPSIIILIDILGIWFSAVYSYHHYFLDVLIGLLCAIIAIFIFEQFVMKTKFSEILDRYMSFVDSK
ncbi:MAG: inositol phosphorylceramide synthase [Saprospiraceae bacterium]|nr:inositol phosphorylceramide synthase [Saprospiraceae bacterium]